MQSDWYINNGEARAGAQGNIAPHIYLLFAYPQKGSGQNYIYTE